MEAALEHIKDGLQVSPAAAPPEHDNRLLDCVRKGELEGVLEELGNNADCADQRHHHHPPCTCQSSASSSSHTPQTTTPLLALHVASIHGHPLVVEALLSRGLGRKGCCKGSIMRNGNWFCSVANTVANPVQIDGSGSIADTDVRDHNGMTPLHQASIRGHQNILLLLLHAEADINAVTCNGDTPLILVCNILRNFYLFGIW